MPHEVSSESAPEKRGGGGLKEYFMVFDIC